jgi:hypothetical protein
MTQLSVLGETDARPEEVEAIARAYRLDFFRLGIAVVGLTAYLGLPAALLIWLVSGLMQIVSERVATVPY